jgi:hypothetical protein
MDATQVVHLPSGCCTQGVCSCMCDTCVCVHVCLGGANPTRSALQLHRGSQDKGVEEARLGWKGSTDGLREPQGPVRANRTGEGLPTGR